MSDNTPDVTIMAAFSVLWHHYRYCYHADILSSGHMWRTIRRQLCDLNSETADWYRRWKVQQEVITLLEDVYLVALVHIHALPMDLSWFDLYMMP